MQLRHLQYTWCCIKGKLHCLTLLFISDFYFLGPWSADTPSHQLHARGAAPRQTWTHPVVLPAWWLPLLIPRAKGLPFSGEILHHSCSGDLVQSQTCGTHYSRSPSSWSSSQFQDMFHPNECGLCTEAECDNEAFSYSVMLLLRFADIMCVCEVRERDQDEKKEAENVAK